jgi:hypothetical protein
MATFSSGNDTSAAGEEKLSFFYERRIPPAMPLAVSSHTISSVTAQAWLPVAKDAMQGTKASCAGVSGGVFARSWRADAMHGRKGLTRGMQGRKDVNVLLGEGFLHLRKQIRGRFGKIKSNRYNL